MCVCVCVCVGVRVCVCVCVSVCVCVYVSASVSVSVSVPLYLHARMWVCVVSCRIQTVSMSDPKLNCLDCSFRKRELLHVRRTRPQFGGPDATRCNPRQRPHQRPFSVAVCRVRLKSGAAMQHSDTSQLVRFLLCSCVPFLRHVLNK